jgi:hypothetical protein
LFAPEQPTLGKEPGDIWIEKWVDFPGYPGDSCFRLRSRVKRDNREMPEVWGYFYHPGGDGPIPEAGALGGFLARFWILRRNKFLD